MQKGTLYIISGPIGNLGDTSFRALEILHTVDTVLSEDTRETAKLLNKYSIEKRQLSYRDQNHLQVIEQITEMLNNGMNLALLSDSGTPLVSDPGFKLVQRVIAEGLEVISIPGPTALISALVVSGLPVDEFVFLGFLPKVKGKKRQKLDQYANTNATMIIYESPFRVSALLSELYEFLGDRKACVVKEMTKIHEEVIRGNLSDIIERLPEIKLKGEFVVLVARKTF